jgi:hypothetical protein
MYLSFQAHRGEKKYETVHYIWYTLLLLYSILYTIGYFMCVVYTKSILERRCDLQMDTNKIEIK